MLHARLGLSVSLSVSMFPAAVIINLGGNNRLPINNFILRESDGDGAMACI
ncbi:hypothetical protein L798_11608 [Zootermopsis nevadensis]|uniref:Uncharacterized protein n=1 Tax=Zootermopsis nevadensis TaxID=136037 RepID=A0A067QWC9_ZOONE|nr:hypothetical protein L798_11608 [Zootermopsis nevadensis]